MKSAVGKKKPPKFSWLPSLARVWRRMLRCRSGEFLKLLLVEEPTDKSVYNKMTCFFTLHAQNGRCDLWSEHYGTEMTLEVTMEADAAFLSEK